MLTEGDESDADRKIADRMLYRMQVQIYLRKIGFVRSRVVMLKLGRKHMRHVQSTGLEMGNDKGEKQI